jgi:2-polyprenyl-3-methyl-5-hydroxy-6-metoxy-1,4-benzoquinol methylase
VKLVTIDRKPEYETDYNINPDLYLRIVYQCHSCKAYINFHSLLDKNFYSGEYNKAITLGTIENRFNRIISLPNSTSDNKQRVKRIVTFFNEHIPVRENPRLLDVGSGTCVFPYEMKSNGFQTSCIDPDEAAIMHARNNVQVDNAHHGDMFNFKTDQKFDLITFNKVLEHFKDPADHLTESGKYLKKDGLIYIELPEGDRIVKTNRINKRAEFAIEHYIIFNTPSIKKLAENCNMEIVYDNIITDPSGKYTIFAFLRFGRRD